jgi:hypothetical protein
VPHVKKMSTHIKGPTSTTILEIVVKLLIHYKVYLTKKIGQKAPHLDTRENFDFQSF